MGEWESLRDAFMATPQGRAAVEQARRWLDEAWRVECRYGSCVVFVSVDSSVRQDLGGWGPISCPCKRNELP